MQVMRSPLNLLLLCVPLAFVLEYLVPAPQSAVFVVAALAIVPLAGWLSRATEELAVRLGTGLGGFLNATFGNATELIISFFALRAGQVEVVKATLVGSIIGNLLLVMGFAAFLGGLRYPLLSFDVERAKGRASLLLIAIIGFVVPAVFDFNERAGVALTDLQSRDADAGLSLGVALILLGIYGATLVFAFGRRAEPIANEVEMEEAGTSWRPALAVAVLLLATVAIAFMSELLVGALGSFTAALSLPTSFVGLVIIPIVGNAAEHASAVIFALKAEMELSVGIALGSALQIALLVAPVLVLLSWAIGQPMDLVLDLLELTALVGAVFIGSSVARDGEMHWLEGLMLLAVYAILAFAFFFTPSGG